MRWLSDLFTSRREMKRLAADRDFYRGRALSLEAEVKAAQETLAADRRLHFEQNLLMVDRFLTAQIKTYAVADHAKSNVAAELATDNRQISDDLKKELYAYKSKLQTDALEAGRTIAEADRLYDEREAALIESYRNRDFGFNN